MNKQKGNITIVIMAVIVLFTLLLVGYNLHLSKKSAERARKNTIIEEQKKAKKEKEKQEKLNKIENNIATDLSEEPKGEVKKSIAPKENVEIISKPEPKPQPELNAEEIRIQKEIESRRQLDELLNRWSDNSNLASRTSRIALAPVVKDMQIMRREIQGIEVTECMLQGKKNLTKGMDAEISAYYDFMSDSKVDISMNILTKLEEFTKYRKKSMVCAPNEYYHKKYEPYT